MNLRKQRLFLQYHRLYHAQGEVRIHRQTRRVVHTFIHGQCLERSQSLIVIHGQYSVKMGEIARS